MRGFMQGIAIVDIKHIGLMVLALNRVNHLLKRIGSTGNQTQLTALSGIKTGERGANSAARPGNEYALH